MMNESVLKHRSAIEVVLCLPKVCDAEIREHCGYDSGPSGPRLYSAFCEYFSTDQDETQWQDLSELEKTLQLVEYEKQHGPL